MGSTSLDNPLGLEEKPLRRSGAPPASCLGWWKKKRTVLGRGAAARGCGARLRFASSLRCSHRCLTAAAGRCCAYAQWMGVDEPEPHATVQCASASCPPHLAYVYCYRLFRCHGLKGAMASHGFCLQAISPCRAYMPLLISTSRARWGAAITGLSMISAPVKM